MWRNWRDWAKSPTGLRTVLLSVLILDLAVTITVWLALPSHGVGSVRIVAGVFVLFPILLLLAIGTFIAVVGAIKDARRARAS